MRMFMGQISTDFIEVLHRVHRYYIDYTTNIEYRLVKHFERDENREIHYTRNVISVYDYNENKLIMREEYTDPYEAENRFMEILTAYAN